ncbi:MAG TPA: MG2 domain-containing protein [Abditibacteriaceae bacterium]|jgi:hypothetical protein
MIPLFRRFAAVLLLLFCFALPSFAQRSITISAPHNFAPDKAVPFHVGGDGIDAARLRVWRLKGEARERLVYQGSLRRKKDDYRITFNVPLLQSGIYLAEAQHGVLVQTTTLRVTNIGLVTKRGARELLVYAVRLTSGLPFANANLRIADDGERDDNGKWTRRPQPIRNIKTNREGMVKVPAPESGNLRVVATGEGNYTQIEAPLGEENETSNKVLFYTERPVYRPGQRVYFKGLVRRDLSYWGDRGPQNALYAPTADAKVQLEVTDAADNKLQTIELKTNANGTFAGQTDLPSDAPIGRYSVEMKVQDGPNQETFYGRFAVQAYRKPEYEISATPLLGGKSWAVLGQSFQVRVVARYFFGAPVTNAKVRYSGDAEGETTLDEKGEAVITVANPRPETQPDEETTRSLNIQVIDATNRSVSTTVAVAAPWSEVIPSLTADRYAYNLQDVAKLTVTTRDPAGRPIKARAKVRLFFNRPVKTKNPDSLRVDTRIVETEFWNGTVETGANGTATISARLGRAGYLRASVSAADSAGRTHVESTNIWVLSPLETNYYGYEFPTLEVAPDRNEYVPGQEVRALVTTAHPGRTALITLEADKIYFARLVKLTRKAQTISFRIPHNAAPGAHFSVGFPLEGQWQSQTTYIKAQDPAKKLQIGIFADKGQYRPGDTASYTVVAKDGAGRPAAGEVSIAFVDKAIYSIAADETPEPYNFFYGPQPLRVSTNYFLPQELEGGAYQRIEKPVAVREKFLDTAYWNPFVITDSKGRASLKFPLPDNLTTWRATARGITRDTKAGVGYSETLVTKPLLVRLTLPRFVVQNDSLQALVVVNNNTKQTQNVRVSLRGEGLELVAVGAEFKGAQFGEVAAGRSTTFRWNLRANEVPKGGAARLTATARADEGTVETARTEDLTDAMLLRLPVLPRGVRVVQADSTSITTDATDATLGLDAPTGTIANAGRLEINVAPSLAGPMLAALPELQGYPYGCTEQTLSRFIPTVVAARTLKSLKKPLPESMKELPKMVSAGLTTLYGYQHGDGGWGWWREDDTDAFLTGYVLYGFALTKDAGFTVERGRVIRGLRSLQDQFRRDREVRSNGDTTGERAARLISPDVRAWMMLGYVSAIRSFGITPTELESKDDFPRAVYLLRDKLSNYSLAALTVAYARRNEATGAGYTQKTKIIRGKEAQIYLQKKNDAENLGRIYYLSKNGLVYYRDAKTKQPIWATTDKGLSVPAGLPDRALAPDSAALTQLLSLLESRAKTVASPSGTTIYWPSLANDGGWRDSDIETTALAIQALVAARPASPQIVPALRWLMNARRGTIWQSTKDSAQAVIALADYLRISQELSPDETVRVLVNGEEKLSAKFGPQDLALPDRRIVLENFDGAANIEIRREGSGAVYASARLTSFTTQGRDVPEDNGFKIERHYSVFQNGVWTETAQVPNGELVRVELRVQTPVSREYVLLEDPIPAGFEAREDDDERAWRIESKLQSGEIISGPDSLPSDWSKLPVTRRETRDDRVALFVSNLYSYKPRNGVPNTFVYRYILRPEQTGTRTALPARIETMYRPDINGRTAINELQVQ